MQPADELMDAAGLKSSWLSVVGPLECQGPDCVVCNSVFWELYRRAVYRRVSRRRGKVMVFYVDPS